MNLNIQQLPINEFKEHRQGTTWTMQASVLNWYWTKGRDFILILSCFFLLSAIAITSGYMLYNEYLQTICNKG